MSLLLWSATIAAVIAGHFGGVWAGAGAAAATVIVEIMLALWIGGWSKKRKASKAPATETSFAPPPDASEASVPLIERQDRTRRPTDILLAVDDLPWNRSYRGDMYVPGRFANDFAFSENLKFFEAPKVEKSLQPQMYLKTYSQIKHVVGNKIAIESESEIAGVEKANGRSEGLIAFRSRDGIWVGFQCDDERFRFRRAVLTALELQVGFPARGPGGFGVTFYFASMTEVPADSLWPQATAILDVAYSDQISYDILHALTDLSLLWDVRLRCSEAMDV